jgi:hypothetical protein
LRGRFLTLVVFNLSHIYSLSPNRRKPCGAYLTLGAVSPRRSRRSTSCAPQVPGAAMTGQRQDRVAAPNEQAALMPAILRALPANRSPFLNRPAHCRIHPTNGPCLKMIQRRTRIVCNDCHIDISLRIRSSPRKRELAAFKRTDAVWISEGGA